MRPSAAESVGSQCPPEHSAPNGAQLPRGEASAGPPPGSGPPSGNGPEEIRSLERLRLVAYFLRYLRPVRGLVVLLVLSTAVAAVTRLPMTFLPKVLTEHFHDRTYLAIYLAFVLGTFVVGWVISVLRGYWGTSLGEAVVRSVRRDVFGNLERLSMLSVYAKGPGEFAQQVGRDVFAVREIFADTLMRSGMEVAQGGAVLISLLVLDPWLTVVLLLCFAVTGWPIRWINRRVERLASGARELAQQIMGRLVENVGGFRDIVAAGRFRGFAEQFDVLLEQSQRQNIRTAVWGQTSGLIPSMVVSLAVLAVYYFGVRRFDEVTQLGAVITYATLLSQLFPAILAAARSTTDLALATPSLLALRQILECRDVYQHPDAPALQAPINQIRFDHVTLDLDGRRIVEDLCFDIPSGQVTAIVGQSGAGKTTVFHLLLRLLEPTSGAVVINGQPLVRYTIDSLRAHVGFIPQNPFIFNASLRENILLASSDATAQERLSFAVEMAQLNEVVAQRQDQGGLDAVAGYMGSRLSGGEKQRVALARLVLRDPAVIICDEYTANVDVRTARLIHEAIHQHFAGRTRVVITHELYIARGADQIIVIERGRVVQQGTHQQLRAVPGLYRELCELQGI